jgi:hypothetical protein
MPVTPTSSGRRWTAPSPWASRPPGRPGGCDSAVAAARETACGDRVAGMAASQADAVHQGLVYDLQVDTTRTEALDCARAIAARVR